MSKMRCGRYSIDMPRADKKSYDGFIQAYNVQAAAE